MPESTVLTVRVHPGPFSDEQIAAVARLHAAEVGEGFLTSLGESVLRLLYHHIGTSPRCGLFVAYAMAGSAASNAAQRPSHGAAGTEHDGTEPLGYICGTRDTRALYREFLWRRWPAALPTLAPRLLSPGRLRRAFETLRYPGQRPIDLPPAEIINFVVAPAARGRGVAPALFADLMRWFAAQPVAAVRIVTGERQVRAHGFYEKVGAELAGRTSVHRGVRSRAYVYRLPGVAPPLRPPARTSFRAITETADTRADADQLAMAGLRHALVARLAAGRDLLDVACGSGYALPLIGPDVRSLTAGDRDATNIRDARAAWPSGSYFLGDAERLPWRAGSFDVIACLEAVYYFRDWRGFLRDAARVLRPDGALVVTWPNPDRPAFHRSPSSTVYPRAAEMARSAAAAGFDARCYGAFPFDGLVTARRRWLDVARRAAVGLHLIPHSMRVRMLVKQLLYRHLLSLGQLTLTPDPFVHLVELGPGRPADFAMLYLIATKPRGALS